MKFGNFYINYLLDTLYVLHHLYSEFKVISCTLRRGISAMFRLPTFRPNIVSLHFSDREMRVPLVNNLIHEITRSVIFEEEKDFILSFRIFAFEISLLSFPRK